MSFSVRQTPGFEKAVLDVIGYLLETLGSIQSAERFMREIDRIVSVLEATPYIKAVSGKPFLMERGLREYYFMNYAILYLVDADTVTLTNLFHQTQAYDSLRYWG